MTEMIRLCLKNSQWCVHKKRHDLNKKTTKHRKLCVFALYGFITNYLKLSGLKHHTSFISQFRQKVWTCFNRFLISGSHKHIWTRKVHFQAQCGHWQSSLPCDCVAEASASFRPWLEPLSDARSHPQFLGLWTSPQAAHITAAGLFKGIRRALLVRQQQSPAWEPITFVILYWIEASHKFFWHLRGRNHTSPWITGGYLQTSLPHLEIKSHQVTRITCRSKEATPRETHDLSESIWMDVLPRWW